ncbi:unnamed protein product [Tilletia controversa]|nr:unnamed protein product [Tilletia controversa]
MVAGAMALYRSIRGYAETPEQLNAVFTTTAKPLPYSRNSTLLNTVAQSGGGLIDVYRAVKSTSRVWPYQLLLNDTHNFNGSQKLTISNVGTQAQTYTLGHLPAGTAYSQDGSGEGNYLAGHIANVAQDQAGVKFNPASVTIAPGRSQDVQVVFTAPNADPAKLAVYSGYVQLKSTQDFGTLTVPYLGVAADFSSIKTIKMTTLIDRGSQFYQDIKAQFTDAQGVDRTVPDGYFRVLLQVLRPDSDPAKACSYESYLSRAFHVKK